VQLALLLQTKRHEQLIYCRYGPITTNRAEITAFYQDSLGISFFFEGDAYFHTEDLAGAKTFALWPLDQVAQSCFGVATWPSGLPPPTSWLEFDVDDVAQASAELQAKGYTLLATAKQEPWEQIVARLLSPEEILVGLTYTPLLWANES
jgi:hypothetical protein